MLHQCQYQYLWRMVTMIHATKRGYSFGPRSTLSNPTDALISTDGKIRCESFARAGTEPPLGPGWCWGASWSRADTKPAAGQNFTVHLRIGFSCGQTPIYSCVRIRCVCIVLHCDSLADFWSWFFEFYLNSVGPVVIICKTKFMSKPNSMTDPVSLLWDIIF